MAVDAKVRQCLVNIVLREHGPQRASPGITHVGPGLLQKPSEWPLICAIRLYKWACIRSHASAKQGSSSSAHEPCPVPPPPLPSHAQASEELAQLVVQLPQAKNAVEVFSLFAERVQRIFPGLQHAR